MKITKNGMKLGRKAVEVAMKNNQVVGENRLYYITVAQLDVLLSLYFKEHAPIEK